MTQPHMHSEDTLIGARRLDPAVLTQIHDRYYPEIYRYVRYRLDDERVCEDIASEVFLRFLDALHRRRGPEQNLRGWLFGTASNLVNDHLRNRYTRKTERLDDHQNIFDDKHPEHTAEISWQEDQLRLAIQELTPEQQHVLALRFADERSIEETAGLMGKTITAIKALQFRAIASLRRVLNGRIDGRGDE
jgi:RNA polymerase sigma-70 factor, ECF subfamily